MCRALITARVLLVVTQVLKYEARHDSALAHFLLRRSLRAPHQVGHTFFWCLKAEMHLPEVSERFGLLLQEYLRCCGAHREQLLLQCRVEGLLKEAAELVKGLPKKRRKAHLQEELAKMAFPARFSLALDPRFDCSGLRIDKCKTMDSKKVPLWLVFTNADPVGDDLYPRSGAPTHGRAARPCFWLACLCVACAFSDGRRAAVWPRLMWAASSSSSQAMTCGRTS